ncbi:hypothetical protein GCM10009836_45630 [Pseudonocardia ailaonensis]|uniref:Uncharacterized protein n=1 Tax=Pseudonocardia ailaonensis TaxID=367279 RepID=A0ABN2NAF6_9PSEU
MRVTERDVERVPPGNLRVPRREFGLLWAAAEARSEKQGARGITDYEAGAIAITCRWLAHATVDGPRGRRRPASAPVTRTPRSAGEELIEAEYVAAETLAARAAPPDWLARQPGYLAAVCATLRWAWRGDGPPPVLADL